MEMAPRPPLEELMKILGGQRKEGRGLCGVSDSVSAGQPAGLGRIMEGPALGLHPWSKRDG